MSAADDLVFDFLDDLLKSLGCELSWGMGRVELNRSGVSYSPKSLIPPECTQMMELMLICHVDNANT